MNILTALFLLSDTGSPRETGFFVITNSYKIFGVFEEVGMVRVRIESDTRKNLRSELKSVFPPLENTFISQCEPEASLVPVEIIDKQHPTMARNAKRDVVASFLCRDFSIGGESTPRNELWQAVPAARRLEVRGNLLVDPRNTFGVAKCCG
jgi:hypothetical protein